MARAWAISEREKKTQIQYSTVRTSNSVSKRYLLYSIFDPGVTVTVNFIFYSEEAQCLKLHCFFGLPRHLHLLFCDCLALYQLFVLCGGK